MADPSNDNSSITCCDPLQDNSVSSLESSNNCDHMQINNSKNAESLVGTPACSMQNEIVPLSGKPYFVCILSKSNAESPYQLVIPRNFYPFLPVATVPVTLCCGNKSWELNYYGDRSLRRFDPQWRNFAIDNKLKVGDACIFELLDDKDLKFKMQILDGEIPKPFANTSMGCDSAAPIIIDHTDLVGPNSVVTTGVCRDMTS